MTEGRATLSIVVPFHNVETWFATCLDSLQAQSYSDFEAILVDDGSQDGSRAVAERYVADDARFRIVTQENAGLGPARNTGADHAQGDFLTFVDSDDLVPSLAYERMIRSLNQTGSDMAAGDARRFNDLGVRPSFVHQEPFATERSATHVRHFPALALDRMAWNKMYRRAFFEAQGFRFPAGLYEDYPVTIRSHVRARSVDVLATPVYYWRERDGGDLSITQRTWELANLEDRVRSAQDVLDFLHAEAPGLLPTVERHLLHIDVSAVAAAVHRNDASEHDKIVALARTLHDRTSPESRSAATPFERVQNHLLAHRQVDELRTLMDYRAAYGSKGPIRRVGWLRPRYYRELPFLDDPDAGVPRHCYEVPASSLTLSATATDTWFDGDELVVELRVAVGKLGLDASSKVRLWLSHPQAQVRRKWPVERFWVNTHRGAELAGVRVRVRPEDLPGGTGFCRFELEVRAQRVRVQGTVKVGESARTRWPAARQLTPDRWMRMDPRGPGFGVLIREVADRVTDVWTEGEEFVVTGLFRGGPRTPNPVFRVRVDGGADRIDVPTRTSEAPERDGLRRFTARFPVSAVLEHGLEDNVTERQLWLVRLLVDDAPRPLAMVPGLPAASLRRGSRRVTLLTSMLGNAAVHEEYASPMVTGAEQEDERLVLTGVADDDARPAEALLRRYVTPADRVDVTVPLTWDGPAWRAPVDVPALIERAGAVVARAEEAKQTPWELLLDRGAGPEPAHIDVSRAWRLPRGVVVRDHHVRLGLGRMARLRLHVEDQVG